MLVIGYFLTRGTWYQCRSLVPRLRAGGWTVWTTSAKPRPWSRLLDMLWTAWHRRASYRAAYVDVYSGRAFFSAELVCCLLRLLRRPYLLNLQGGDLPRFALCWPRRVRRLLRSAARVATPSPPIAQMMRSFRPDLLVLPHGLDLHDYPFRHRRVARPRLVWLRGFRFIYNPALAVEILALLRQEFPGIELTMFGADRQDGTLAKTLQRASELGVGDRLHVPGPIPKSEVPVRLAAGDIFLNTTTAESFGIGVLEAASLGLCIVSTDVGALPHLWRHEKEVLLVSPNDPGAMAAAVRRILTEPDLAACLSSNARRKAERFDWKVVFPQWQFALDTLAQIHSS